MREHSTLTAVRLQLKALGYDPIPLRIDKKPYTGWPKEPNDPDSIGRWGRYFGAVATGIRLYQSPGLFVLDLDIRIAAIRDAILQAYEQRWPEFMSGCVRRHSQGVPLALIGRSDARTNTLRSRRWQEKDNADEKDNRVEVFTPRSKRYLGVDGAHSASRSYAYHGRPLWEVPPGQLAEFPAGDISAALSVADEIMQAAGLTAIRAAGQGGESARIVYDLTDAMRFENENDSYTLDELEDARIAAGHEGRELRVTSSFLGYGTNPTKCIVGYSRRSRCVFIHDFETGLTHMPADRAPSARFEFLNQLQRRAFR
jgi:hypothetical protein